MAYDIVIPDPVLEKADRITLKIFFNRHRSSASLSVHWATAFATRIFHEVSDEADEFLQFRMHQLMGAIPYETRRACFDEVGRIFREQKENRYER